MASVFGEPDPLPTAGESKTDGEDGENNNNPYPEAEIDEMRAVRDTALTRYIQVPYTCAFYITINRTYYFSCFYHLI